MHPKAVCQPSERDRKNKKKKRVREAKFDNVNSLYSCTQQYIYFFTPTMADRREEIHLVSDILSYAKTGGRILAINNQHLW